MKKVEMTVPASGRPHKNRVINDGSVTVGRLDNPHTVRMFITVAEGTSVLTIDLTPLEATLTAENLAKAAQQR